jgi:hypothetical protein
VEHLTTLEPYLKGSQDKDDQDIAYHVVSIYHTVLSRTQLTFQPEFLSRAIGTIAANMSSGGLKVNQSNSKLIVASQRERAFSLSYRRHVR